jgi:methylthioribose-1-phosphate isomerase
MTTLPFFWKDAHLYILDQRKLPFKKFYIKCKTYRDVISCIKNMAVRGAPAIGIVSGYGMFLAIENFKNGDFKKYIEDVAKEFISCRPTAYNLTYVVNKVKDYIYSLKLEKPTKKDLLKIFKKVEEIREGNKRSLQKIVKFGLRVLKKNSCVLTHCNTGALACGDIGTALGIIIEGYKRGKVKYVYVDETRPYLQGARLTMFELMDAGVPCCMITDNMAGYVIKEKKVDCIIIGADRIAKNGDTANKIGSYSLAILAKYHNIPFYVVAPTSSIDKNIESGKEIKIEYRDEDEVKYINGKLITLKNAKVIHPTFDVTPAELITAIITEEGIFRYPYEFSY